MTGNPSAADLETLLGEEGFVRGLARSLLFDEHAADDVVQQVWLRALERPPRATTQRRGWLAVVARNLSRNEIRGRVRRRAREIERASTESVPATVDVVAREAMRKRMLDAVLGLDELYRDVVLARYYDGLAPSEIARRVGVPAGTVRTRLKRALEQLRARLDAEHGGDRAAWCSALLPFARPGEAVAPGLVGFGSAALGALAMKKVWLLFAVALMVGLGVLVAWPQDPDGIAERRAAAPPPAVGTGVDPVVHERPAAPVLERIEQREAGVSRDVYAASLAGFRGRLVDAAGAPVADQRVRIASVDAVGLFVEPQTGSAPGTPRVEQRSAVSGQGGVFAIDGVWPRGRYALFFGAPGRNEGFRILEHAPGPGEIVDLGDVVFDATAVVTGRVVDGDGAPIAGASVWAAGIPAALFAAVPLDRFDERGPLILAAPEVAPAGGDLRVHDETLHALLRRGVGDRVREQSLGSRYLVLDVPAWLGDWYRALPSCRATTGEDGGFRLEGLVPGGHALVVRADRWRTGGKARVLVRAGKVRDVGDLALDRGETVRGRIVTADGHPVAAAEVAAASTDGLIAQGLLCARPSVRSRADGSFAVGGLRRGRVAVAVRAHRGAAWAVSVRDGDDDSDVVLPTGLTCTFALTGPGAGVLPRLELVPGATLGELARVGMQRPLDLAGRVTVEPGRVRVDGVLPGVYTVRMSGEGLAEVVELLSVDRAGEYRIAGRAEATAEIAVVDPGGRPVVGASVFATPDPAPRELRSWLPSGASLAHWRTLPAFVGQTGTDGSVSLRGLPAGTAVVNVRHPGFGAARETVVLPRRRLRIALPGCGAIEGQVTERGEAVSGGEWRILVRRVDRSDFALPDIGRMVVPDDEGRFRIDGLTPGEHQLKAEPSVRDVRSLGAVIEHIRKVDYSWGTFGGSSLEVTVRAGETTPARFDVDTTRAAPGAPSGTLSGTVLVDGQPAVGMRLDTDNGEIATVDAAGRFAAKGLVTGQSMLRLYDPQTHRTLWSQRIEMRGGEDRAVAIDVVTATLRGIVMRVDGQPAAECPVDFQGAGVYAFTKTDKSGHFTAHLPLGEYRVIANLERLERAVVEGVRVGDGAGGAATPQPITLQLVTLGRFAGRVESDTPLPSRVGLMLETPNGGFNMTILGDDGTFDLRGISPGTYSLRISGRGFDHATVPATVELTGAPLVDQVLRIGARRDG